MTQRADIINRIQKATSLKEQGALVADLDRFDREAASRHQAASSADWAGMVVQDTLAPATAHERSTHETDWLGEITASTDDWANKVSAEAALWFGRVSPEVKADRDEFSEQAKGMARRTASAYGERMIDAEQAFLSYVSFLHTQAASGLDQVEQIVDSHENSKQTGLPTDVFETFGPPVHPINQGVSGTETSERAPLLQEIESDGGGGGAPSHHDETQSFEGEAPKPSELFTGRTAKADENGNVTPDTFECRECEATISTANKTAANTEHKESCSLYPHNNLGEWPKQSYFQPTVAIGHTSNLTDYLAGLSAEALNAEDEVTEDDFAAEDKERTTPSITTEYSADPYGGKKGSLDKEAFDPKNPNQGVRECKNCGSQSGMRYGETSNKCSNCGTVTPRLGAHKEGASGLDQVEQVVDNQENPRRTTLPEEVAFPWEIEEQPDHEERSDKKTSGLTPAQARAAHVARLSAKPDQDLTDTDRKEIRAFAASLLKTADQWSQGGEQSHGPGSANTPGTTPVGTGGTEQAGQSAGQADWNAGGNQPTYADDSASVPPFVQGYSEGYGQAAQANPTPGAAQPGLLPPGAGGVGQGYQTHSGSVNMNTTAGLQVEAKVVNCSQCGKQDQHYNMQQRGNGTSVVHTCRDCAPVPSDPNKVRWQGSLKVSAAFVAPIEAADPDFAKAYKYASKWAEGTRLVKKGSASFEAGLYAGMSDNPEAQDAWVEIHRKAATRYQDRTYTDRIRLHRDFTLQAAQALPGMTVVGSYLQAPLEKTAATSTDLDTMGPGVSPNAGGQTPINGPGTPPPLQGGTDPARPGGPAPYNGAEPFGTPAVPTGLPTQGTPTAIDTTPGGPVDQAAYQRLSPQNHAFRKTVQANLLKTKQPR